MKQFFAILLALGLLLVTCAGVFSAEGNDNADDDAYEAQKTNPVMDLDDGSFFREMTIEGEIELRYYQTIPSGKPLGNEQVRYDLATRIYRPKGDFSTPEGMYALIAAYEKSGTLGALCEPTDNYLALCYDAGKGGTGTARLDAQGNVLSAQYESNEEKYLLSFAYEHGFVEFLSLSSFDEQAARIANSAQKTEAKYIILGDFAKGILFTNGQDEFLAPFWMVSDGLSYEGIYLVEDVMENLKKYAERTKDPQYWHITDYGMWKENPPMGAGVLAEPAQSPASGAPSLPMAVTLGWALAAGVALLVGKRRAPNRMIG